MDIAAVVVAVIAGAGSGFLSALVTPFAQRRGQESRDRTQARRELIAKGRILVQKADAEGWSPVEISQAVDWLTLRAHLPKELVEDYTPRPRTSYVSSDSVRHGDLADAIDQLERAWRLV